MATVAELSGPYANFMLSPRPPATAGVCSVCMTFTEGQDTCYPCGWEPRFADAVLPISYSVHFGQLHTALAQYKRATGTVGRRLQMELAAVLWRFLREHESCLAAPSASTASTWRPRCRRAIRLATPSTRCAGSSVATSVPRAIATSCCSRGRAQRWRSQSTRKVQPGARRRRRVGPAHRRHLDAGSNAQSAAAALKTAGASQVAVLVIGRHIHAEYKQNAARLKELPRTFDWSSCALHNLT